MRSLIVIAALVACIYGATLPLNFNQLPEQFKEFVPEEVKNFYAELTDEDKAILKEVAAQHDTFENEDQALEALKAKSEKLYNKANDLRNLVKNKIDSLNPEAKIFVTNIIEKLCSLRPKGDEKPNLNKLKESAKEVIEQYKALSDDAKNNLKETFPKITGIISNEKFQKLAKGLLDGPAN
uniref:Fatty-acid and retinol-binding protein 1 n=1 Tax=Acrobeloides nanus TaxID=290746 RepID=A0A914C8I2_9BILA